MDKTLKMRQIIESIFILTVNLQKVADRILHSEINLTLSQFRMLMAINHHPGLSQKDIADFWGIEEASVSRQIGILTDKKLISIKNRAASKREHSLSLASPGKKIIEKAILVIENQSEDIFRDVGQKQREDLYALLELLINSVKREREYTNLSHHK